MTEEEPTPEQIKEAETAVEEQGKDEEEEQEEEGKEASEDMITRANAAAIRLEEANKEMAKLLEKQEALKVEETLGGKTEAGKPSKTKEQKEQEEAEKFMEGTGLDPFEK